MAVARRTGYVKNYNYDDRLANILPPYLFDISNSGWHISRETLCTPPGTGSEQPRPPASSRGRGDLARVCGSLPMR